MGSKLTEVGTERQIGDHKSTQILNQVCVQFLL
jgi:hypothetical protein